MQRLVLLMLVLTSVECQQSEKYLQNAIRDLRQLNVQSLRRADSTQLSSSIKKKPDPEQYLHERRYNEEVHVPSLALTKGELAAIYENAVSKGETIKLDAGDNTYIHAAVHELNDDDPKYHEDKQPSSHDDEDGYYYYYYPIKSFLDEITAQAGTSNEYAYKPKPTRPVLTTQKPQYQFHSHHHQHNITINKAIQEEKKPSKALEPLFMAISGFIGMAVMLVFSVVFMSSKFSSKPTKHREWSKKDNHIDDLSRLALNALDGQCAERFACELSKRARNFSFQDNRFIKLLKRLAPGGFQKHIDKVGKYTKQIKCTAIPCKKNNNKNQKNQKKKNAPQKKH